MMNDSHGTMTIMEHYRYYNYCYHYCRCDFCYCCYNNNNDSRTALLTGPNIFRVWGLFRRFGLWTFSGGFWGFGSSCITTLGWVRRGNVVGTRVLSLVKSHVLAARVLLCSVKHLFNTSNSHGSTDIYRIFVHAWMDGIYFAAQDEQVTSSL